MKFCGLNSRKKIWTKEEVSDRLIDLEKKLNRPLSKQDISLENVGFSNIVIHRLYGSFGNAKKEIGLLKSNNYNGQPFEYYKQNITDIVRTYIKTTGNEYITWRDIESGEYGSKISHHAYLNAFKKVNEDFHLYVRSLGCMFNKNGFSHSYTFEDGEITYSNLEYKVSSFLRENGFVYNVDYFRSVPYKQFSNDSSKMNCDYYFPKNGLYVEVAGIISSNNGKWKDKEYSTEQENEYKNTLIKKEDIFIKNKLNYLFLFPEDIQTDFYKKLILS